MAYQLPSRPFRQSDDWQDRSPTPCDVARAGVAAPTFGRRGPPRQFACSQNCGHPGCTKGCTLIERKRALSQFPLR